jgi:microcystin-dependent protein
MEGYLGEIKMFGGQFAPRNWALCDGQLLPINQNQALYSILGTVYGGDGRTTFALPDLRSRVAMHPGDGPGLTSRRQGEKLGSETNTLTVNQMPPHGHPVPVPLPTETAETTTFTGLENQIGLDTAALEATEVQYANLNAESTGGGHPVNNVQPSLCVNFIICIQGDFPDRN